MKQNKRKLKLPISMYTHQRSEIHSWHIMLLFVSFRVFALIFSLLFHPLHCSIIFIHSYVLFANLFTSFVSFRLVKLIRENKNKEKIIIKSIQIIFCVAYFIGSFSIPAFIYTKPKHTFLHAFTPLVSFRFLSFVILSLSIMPRFMVLFT